MSVLGATEPHFIGRVLGTGYERFYSETGMNGLAREDGDRLNLLALDASNPGTGQFREFIEQAKKEYKTICIWHVSHEWLKLKLLEYGFRPYDENDIITTELLKGYRYDAGTGRHGR